MSIFEYLDIITLKIQNKITYYPLNINIVLIECNFKLQGNEYEKLQMESLGKDNPVYESDSDDNHDDTGPRIVTKPPVEDSVEPGLQDQFWEVSYLCIMTEWFFRSMSSEFLNFQRVQKLNFVVFCLFKKLNCVDLCKNGKVSMDYQRAKNITCEFLEIKKFEIGKRIGVFKK